MTPHTVHLLAQMIRYQRGMMTSIERWAATLPPSPAQIEIAAATTLMREVLVSYEHQLCRVDTVMETALEPAGVDRAGILVKE